MTERVGTLVRAVALASAFIGGALIVLIQPVITQRLSPGTGSNPLLWTGLQSLFQLFLLAGYSIATHIWNGRRETRATMCVAYVMCCASAGLLLLFGRALAMDETTSVWSALLVVTASVGWPFVVLSTNALTCQYLMRSTGIANPGWVFGVSNLGSLGGATLYPIVIEPFIGLTQQIMIWKATVGTWSVVIALAVLVVARRGGQLTVERAPRDFTVGEAVRWFAAGALPVALFLSSTSRLSIDAGSHPIVWLGPFVAYLATMSAAFSVTGRRYLARVEYFVVPLGLTVMLLLRPLGQAGEGLEWFIMTATAVMLAGLALRLAANAPEGYTPWFFTLVTLGGVVTAAVLTAIPIVLGITQVAFPTGYVWRIALDSLSPEFLLAIAATLWVCTKTAPLRFTDMLAGACTGACLALAESSGAVSAVVALDTTSSLPVLGYVLVLIAAAVLVRSRLSVVTAMIAAAAVTLWRVPIGAAPLVHFRSPFGHVRVVDTGPTRTLFHGTTAHGEQSLTCLSDDQACALKEGSYYDASSPIGRLLDGKARTAQASLRMGVIGLGVGALADYCRSGDSVRFFEVDPIIKRVADSLFSHLRLARDRCGSVEVILGDGRRRVREEPANSLDVLVIDAFSSDSIPTHLLTLEAFREARAVLATGRGLIAVHVSNRYIDLTGLIASNAESLGMISTAFTDRGSKHRLPSQWVVMGEAQDETRLPLMRHIADGVGIRGTRPKPGTRWTDDRRSLLPLYF